MNKIRWSLWYGADRWIAQRRNSPLRIEWIDTLDSRAIGERARAIGESAKASAALVWWADFVERGAGQNDCLCIHRLRTRGSLQNRCNRQKQHLFDFEDSFNGASVFASETRATPACANVSELETMAAPLYPWPATRHLRASGRPILISTLLMVRTRKQTWTLWTLYHATWPLMCLESRYW